MHTSLRAPRGLRPLAPSRRSVAVAAARPRRDAGTPSPSPLVIAAPAPSSLFLEPALRSFVLGVGAGALFETAHVLMKVRESGGGEAKPLSRPMTGRARDSRGRAGGGAALLRPPAPLTLESKTFGREPAPRKAGWGGGREATPEGQRKT